MGLTFTGSDTDKAEFTLHANATNLCPFTIWAWVNATSLSNGLGIFQTGSASGYRDLNVRSTGQIDCELDMTTTDSNARSANSAGNRITTGEWWFVATTVSSTFVPRIYLGTLTSSVVETAYVTQTTGVGTKVTEDGGTARWGNRTATGSFSFNGNVAIGGYHSTDLTVAQLELIRLHPSFARMFSNVALHHLGISTQDFSGLAQTLTITGATVAAHVPLGPLFSFTSDMPYIIAAAAARYAHRQILAGVG